MMQKLKLNQRQKAHNTPTTMLYSWFEISEKIYLLCIIYRLLLKPNSSVYDSSVLENVIVFSLL